MNEDDFMGFIVESIEDDIKGVLYHLKLIHPVGSIIDSVSIAPYFRHKEAAQEYAKTLNRDMQAGYHPPHGFPILPPLYITTMFYSFGSNKGSETRHYANIVGDNG